MPVIINEIDIQPAEPDRATAASTATPAAAEALPEQLRRLLLDMDGRQCRRRAD